MSKAISKTRFFWGANIGNGWRMWGLWWRGTHFIGVSKALWEEQA